MRGSNRGRAGTARWRGRYDTICLYPRSRPKPGRDLELLTALAAPLSGRSSIMLEAYGGSCHCGRVRFRVRADLADILECNCSVCTKKGILHLIVPPAQFELLQGKEALETYQFNTNTAQH